MIPEKPKGIAFYCQDNGTITEVITDDFGIITNELHGKGKLFQNLIDVASRNKAFDFLVDIKTNKIAFDYQLNLSFQEEIRILYFMGIQVADKLLIVGANNHKDIMDFTGRMQEISNEQANLIRTLMKDQYREDRKIPEPFLFDELTRLNNELINLQRELARKNAELHKLNELKNKFLGIAAHDLRNPISVIMGFSDYLIDDLGDTISADQIKILNTIQRSSEFMLHLLEDLLEISVNESGKLNLNLQKTDISALVRNNIELNRVVAAKKNIRIDFINNEPIPEIRIDSNKIEQVMNNLISNALKFSLPGTCVTVNLSVKEGQLMVKVSDQGQGIPAVEMEKLFIPFQRTSTRSTAGEKSTGLGLSIVKNIIQGHGGKIWAESIEGTGSAFFFSLPLNILL